jgi:hypothetical protein
VTRVLRDINVLVALLDSDHVDHSLAHDWLDDEIDAGWAWCAINRERLRTDHQPIVRCPLLRTRRLGGPPDGVVEVARGVEGVPARR